MRELADAVVEARTPAQRDLDEINRALRTHYTWYLVPAGTASHSTTGTRAIRSPAPLPA